MNLHSNFYTSPARQTTADGMLMVTASGTAVKI